MAADPRFQVANPSNRPATPSTSQPGVYADVAKWRRQQTLTPDQLDPTKNSARRRKLYRSGKPS